MINITKLLLATAAALSFLNAEAECADSIVCHITGTVVDRPESKLALLMEYGTDMRVTGAKGIDIIDGKFSYDLKTDVPRQYEIIFDDEERSGGWRIKSFFVDNGDVELTYYNDELADSNRVVSSLPDNIVAARWKKMCDDACGSTMKRLIAEMDSLYNRGKAYSEPLKELMSRYEAAKNGTAQKDSLREEIIGFFQKDEKLVYTPEVLAIRARQREMQTVADSLTLDMISREPTLFGLSKIKSVIRQKSDRNNIDGYIDAFNTVYRESFAEHPYTAEILMALDALAVKKGNRYPDFNVTRPDGSTERIAELIKGKIAVIDLWASWCGPCRRHSIALIPIYEQYRDRGFTVVAIAREAANCDAMNEAMRKDGYPWESFVDLNDKGNIWKMNDAGNAGGRIILVGSDGIIVETDATPESIDKYLKDTISNN